MAGTGLDPSASLSPQGEHDSATIAAIATPSGAGGICVIRLSGSDALAIGDRLMPHLSPSVSARPANRFVHTTILHPQTRALVDDAVVLIYRAPHSFTGEDTLEIQGHGGTLPARRLLAAVLEAGARPAAPGEFTRRAFLHGRLDLTQAEALCAFIASKSERAAEVARGQLSGVLGQTVTQRYEAVREIAAEVAVLLDFDESDLPPSLIPALTARITAEVAPLARLIDSWQSGHLLRDGALVVISGQPNAGKSSLLNALLGRDRAIVHDVPGTTRDLIEESMLLHGVPLRLVDTAGLRDTRDVVEREGMARARALMRQADLNLHLIDRSTADVAHVAHETAQLPARRTLLLLTKCDLPAAPGFRFESAFPICSISVKSNAGLSEMKTRITEMLGLEHEAHDQTIISLRQVEELRTALHHLHAAAVVLPAGSEQLVFAAQHLGVAAEALGRLLGRVYSEELLDTVFSRFCVGK